MVHVASKFSGVVAAVAGVVFCTALAACSAENDQQSSSRHAIAQCWHDQSAKSIDPAQARFIAGACEMLEAKFRDKWKTNP